MAIEKYKPTPLPANLVKAARSRVNPSSNLEKGAVVPNTPLYKLLNETVASYRSSNSTVALLRHLSRVEGPISTAVHNIVQTANGTHLVTAFDAATGIFSAEGTALANRIMASFDTVYDYSAGFTDKKSMEGLKGHALREVCITGALAAELVLDQIKLPTKIQIVPSETIQRVSDGKGSYYPQQVVAGQNDPVSLDIPTFWLSMMQHDANGFYPQSMMDSSVKMLLFFEEFLEDIRKVIRQNGHTRTVVTLSEEKMRKAAPRTVQNDPEKLKAWLSTIQAQVQSQLESIAPEQALVVFDTAQVENLQSGMGSKTDYTPLLGMLAGMYATSMKTPPSALGMRLEGGSQALGNVESLIFIKSAAAIQTPVEDVFSRALTLACRLHGADVFVRFEFDPINLRPVDELEAFNTMRETRILNQLSLGLISDDYAAHLLRTGPRPPGAPVLSGTMFNHKSSQQPDPALGDTAMGRTLQPGSDLPRKGGGKSQ